MTNIFNKLLFLAATTIPYTQFRAPYNISPINEVTYGMFQAGAPPVCVSSNGTELYTCNMSGIALSGYTFGMTFSLWVDTPSSTPEVNIDNNGAVGIFDTVTGESAVSITANCPHQIFFDGKVFRLEF
jgi:hypothetical protein